MKQEIPVHNTDNGNSNKNVHLLEKFFFPLVKEISPRWKSKYPKYDNGWAF